jgi:hypothetical protein
MARKNFEHQELSSERRKYDGWFRWLSGFLKKEAVVKLDSIVMSFEELDWHSKFEIVKFLLEKFLEQRKADFSQANENLLMILYLKTGSKEETLRWWVANQDRPQEAFQNLKNENIPAYDAFQTFLESFAGTDIQINPKKEQDCRILKFKAFEQDFELEVESSQ